MGNIGVHVSVEEHRRRIAGCHVAYRTERVERLGLLFGVVAGHLLGPQAILPAVSIEQASIGRPVGFGDRSSPYHGPRRGFCDEGLATVERVRFAVPGTVDVAISVEG